MKQITKQAVRITILLSLIFVIAGLSQAGWTEKSIAKSASQKTKVDFEGKTMYINWDWNYLKGDATAKNSYNKDLAIAGLVLSAAANFKKTECEKILRELSFDIVDSKHYGDNGKRRWMDYPAMTFAYKKVTIAGKKKHIIVAVFRGTGEWDYNDIATDIKSQGNGFLDAGKNSKMLLKGWIPKDKGIKKSNTILFITGHSYGAATASQVARKTSDIAPKKSTFVYTYASLNYDTQYEDNDANAYPNIHNIINKRDIVPNVPIGYRKVGHNRNYDYATFDVEKKKRFNKVYSQIAGREYKYEDVLKLVALNMILKNTKQVGNEHAVYTYMAHLLSDSSDKTIDNYFTKKGGTAKQTAKKPEKVKTITCTTSKNTIAIKWKKAKNAKKYAVYVKKGNGKWNKVKTTDKLSYSYKGAYNTNYSVKVRGISGKTTGAFSTTKKVKTAKKTAKKKSSNTGKPSNKIRRISIPKTLWVGDMPTSVYFKNKYAPDPDDSDDTYIISSKSSNEKVLKFDDGDDGEGTWKKRYIRLWPQSLWAKKAGKSTITVVYMYKGKKYTEKATCVALKYPNPFSKFTINGSKIDTKKHTFLYTNNKYKKSYANIVITPNKGWKIAKVITRVGKEGSYEGDWKTVRLSPQKLKKGVKIKLAKRDGACCLHIKMKNKDNAIFWYQAEIGPWWMYELYD